MSKKGSIPNSSSDLCYGFETICWDKPRKVATTLNNSPDTAAMPPLHILFLIGEGESESSPLALDGRGRQDEELRRHYKRRRGR